MAAIASRYARAFSDVVFDLKLDATQVTGELQSLVDVFQSSVELRRVWESPAIPAEQKRRLLDSIVERGGLSRPVRNFVAVLIDQAVKKRIQQQQEHDRRNGSEQ